MTTSETSPESVREVLARGRTGTLAAIGWAGENADDGRETAFLLVYSLGDGAAGAEAGRAAARSLLYEAGLPTGDPASANGSANASVHRVRLTVEDGLAVLRMPQLSVEYAAPPEWTAAARERGHVYFLFATRPWPEGSPGSPVSEAVLRDFIDDEEMLSTAAHCMLPVHSPSVRDCAARD